MSIISLFSAIQIKKYLAFKPALFFITSLFLLASLSVQASPDLPVDGEVVAGSADLDVDGDTLNIDQHSDQLILNWEDFSIGENNTVNFLQDSSDVALNRVVSDNPSFIYGNLNAGGQVFLVNQAGILFSSTARVDAAGIVASSLDISDQDFLAGNYEFSGSGGSVVNDGQINIHEGGYAALIGEQVRNGGIISARLGQVVLASGNRVSFELANNSLFNFEVDEAAVAALVANQGLIQAEGGQVILSARSASDLLSTVVNNEGVIEASSIEERDGKVFLTASGGNISSSGSIDVSGVDSANGGSVVIETDETTLVSGDINAASGANGGEGGSVKVLGNLVGLQSGASINASGINGGGEVLIGGDYQGANENVRNAWRTHIANDVSIAADAIENGDGGKVIVWADDSTRFYGNISATGGAQSGNGGFAEVSGKHNLAYQGTTDLTAANGLVGNLLLDPDNIIIVDAAGGDDAELLDDQILFADGTPGDFTISNDVLDAATAAVTLQANNDITVNAGAGVNMTQDLTLQANNNIILNDNITSTGDLALTADADASGAGTIDFSGGGALSGDNVNLSSGSALALGDVTAAGNLSVTNAAVITQFGATVLDVTGTSSFNVTGAPVSILVTNNNLFDGVVTFSGSSGVDVRNDQDLILGASSMGSLYAVSNNNNITQSGALTITGGGITVIDAGTANIELTDAANSFSGAVTLTGADVDLTSGAALNLANVSATTLDVITSNDAIIQSGFAAVTGASSFNAGTANITLNQATNDFGGAVTVTTTGQATVVDANALAVGGNAGTLVALAGGALDFTGGTYTTLNGRADGDITQSGVLSVGNQTNLTADTNAITVNLNNAANDFMFTVNLNTVGGGSFSSASITDVNVLAINGSAGVLNAIAGDALRLAGGTYTTLNGTAGGNIFQNSALDVSGTTTLTSNAAGIDVTLTNASNEFNTLVLVEGTGDFDLVEVTDADTSANNLSIGGNATTLTVDADDDLDFTGGTYTTLNGTVGGNISDSGVLTVSGTSTFTSDAAVITVDLNDASDFGTVVLASTGAGSINGVGVVDTNGLIIGGDSTGGLAVNAGGTLDFTGGSYGSLLITAGGNITQSGALAVTGTSSVNAGASDITLSHAANNFGGAVTLTGANVDIRDTSALDLQAATYATLDVIADGITQTGALTISGISSFDAGTADITLANAANNFGGAVTLAGANVDITDTTALDLQGATYATLDVIADGITQSGALGVSGASSFTAGTADITLANAVNNFGGAVTISSTGNVDITDSTALDLAAGTYTTLDVIAAGITQSGALAVTGASSFNAGTADISLTNAANDFGGVMTLTGANVSINAASNLNFGVVNADTINASTSGNITDNAGLAITITDTANFNAGSSVIDIRHQNQHTFGGLVTLAAGHIVDFAVSGLTAFGNITASNVSNVTNRLTSSGGGINLTGDITIGATSDLEIRSGADVTQSAGTIVVDQLIIDSASNVTLNGANDFNSFTTAGTTISSGLELSLTDVDGLDLGVLEIQSLTLNLGGALTQSGAVTVSGDTNINAGTNDISLVNAANNFGGAVALTGNNVDITNNAALNLGAISAATLDVISTNNAITQSGAAAVTGASSFNAGTADITLANAANNFGGVVTLTGANVDITDSTALALAAGSYTTLDVIADGITQTGALTVSGLSSFNSGASDITLTNAANNFGGAVALTGANVDITNNEALNLAAISATTLDVITSNDAITQSAAAVVTGASSFNAGTADITLTNAGNNFGGTVALTGANVDITNTTALELAAGTYTTLDVIADGITQSGALTVSGLSSFDSGTGDVVLTNTANAFTGEVTLDGNNVSIVNNIDLALGAVNTTGTVSAEVTAAASAINIANAINAGGAVTITTANVAQVINLGSIITTTDDNVILDGAVVLSADAAIDTGAGVGDINFNSSVDGTTDFTENLTLTAGTGDINFASTVGNNTDLGTLLINSANDVDFADGFSLTNFTQLAGTGTTTINSSSPTMPITGNFDFNGNNLTVSRTLDVGGAVTITNSGLFTLSSGHNIDADLGFAQDGTGANALGGNITTVDNTISFAGATTLFTPITLNTGVGAGDITFANTINGFTAAGQNLTLLTGTGNATLSGVVGGTNSLGNFAFTGNDFTLNQALTSGGTVTINNAGTFTTAAAGDITATGGFTQGGAGSSSLSGDITTTNQNISFATPIVLTGDVAMDTGAAGGNITFTGTVDGTTNFMEDLTLTAGTGNITAASALGASNDLGLFWVNSADDVLISNTIDATAFIQLAGTGTTTMNGVATLNNSLNFNGNNLTVNQAINAANFVNVNHTGTFTTAAAGDITLASGGFFQGNATGTNSLAGDITTTANINFQGATTLTGPVALDTGTGSGNIIFNNTLDGTQNLTLSSGSGDVRFNSTVGATNSLGDIIINNASFVLFNGVSSLANFTQLAGSGFTFLNAAVSLSGNFDYTGTHLSVAQALTVGGTTEVTNSGVFLTDASGDIMATGGLTQDGTGPNSLAGDITTTNTNISLASATTLAGPVLMNTGAGAGDITFASTLNGANTLGLTAGTGNIDFQGVIGGVTPLTDLTITSAADVGFDAASTLANITQVAGTGTTTVDGLMTLTGNLDFTGTNLTVNQAVDVDGTVEVTNSGNFTTAATGDVTADGGFTQNGTGANDLSGDINTTNTDISFATAITLSDAVAMNTDTMGDIAFLSTIDGAQDLTLTAGTGGDITFAGVVGGMTPLADLLITSAAQVNVDAAITAASITQNTGSATTNVSGDITATTGDIDIATNQIVQNANITATLGNVVLDSATNIALDDGAISSGRLIHLIAGTGVLQSAFAHDGLAATDLLLEGSGDFTLVNNSATNLITNVATVGTLNGFLNFENDQALVIGAVTDNAAMPVTSNGVTANTLVVTTTAGDLTVNEAVDATMTNVLLQSQAASLVINNTVDATQNASLLAATNITQSADGDVTVGGTLDVEAQGGTITMTDGAVSDAAGNVRYLATGDITLASVDGANVRIESTGGSIIDGGETDVDVIAATAQLVAANNIGQLDGTGNGLLETAVTTAAASANTGSIYLSESDNLTIGSVAAITLNRVTNTGLVSSLIGSTLTGVVAATDAIIEAAIGIVVDEVVTTTAGDLLLQTQSGDLAINAAVTAGDDASLISSANITQAATGTVTTGGSLDVQAQAGTIVMADGAVSDAVGNIRYLATGDITLASLDSDANIRVESTGGNIIDGGDLGVDVIAVNAQLVAANNIGEADGTNNGLLETTVTTLAANATSGDIFVQESDSLVIGSVAAIDVTRVETNTAPSVQAGALLAGITAGSDAIVRATTGLTISEAVAATAGNVLLEAQAGDLAINNIVNAGMNASLLASANVTQSAAGDVTVNGTLDVNAQGGNITMTDGAVSDVTGNIRYLATGDITLASLNSDANVVVDAGGNIIDGGETDVDVVAVSAQLRAGNSIGTLADDIETTVTNLAALATAGNIFVDETDVLNLTEVAAIDVNRVAITNTASVEAGSVLTGVQAQTGIDIEADSLDINQLVDSNTGNILLRARSGGIDQSTAAGIVRADAGNVELIADDGDIELQLVSAIGNTVTLTASDDVINNNGAANNIVANDLIISADDFVGAAAGEFTDPTSSERITTQVENEINVTLAQAGSVSIDNTSADGSVDVVFNLPTPDASNGSSVWVRNNEGLNASGLEFASTNATVDFDGTLQLIATAGDLGLNLEQVGDANDVDLVAQWLRLSSGRGAFVNGDGSRFQAASDGLTMTADQLVIVTGGDLGFEATVDQADITATGMYQIASGDTANVGSIEAGDLDIELSKRDTSSPTDPILFESIVIDRQGEADPTWIADLDTFLTTTGFAENDYALFSTGTIKAISLSQGTTHDGSIRFADHVQAGAISDPSDLTLEVRAGQVSATEYAGNILIDPSVIVLVENLGETNTGTTSLFGSVTVNGEVTSREQRSIELQGRSGNIVIDADTSASGRVVLSPGAGFDVIFTNAAIFEITRSATAAGDLIIIATRNVVMELGTSIVADGSVIIGADNITGSTVVATDSDAVTGDLLLTDITANAETTNNDGVGSVFAYTTGSSAGETYSFDFGEGAQSYNVTGSIIIGRQDILTALRNGTDNFARSDIPNPTILSSGAAIQGVDVFLSAEGDIRSGWLVDYANGETDQNLVHVSADQNATLIARNGTVGGTANVNGSELMPSEQALSVTAGDTLTVGATGQDTNAVSANLAGETTFLTESGSVPGLIVFNEWVVGGDLRPSFFSGTTIDAINYNQSGYSLLPVGGLQSQAHNLHNTHNAVWDFNMEGDQPQAVPAVWFTDGFDFSDQLNELVEPVSYSEPVSDARDASGLANQHEVVNGDTLWSIAERYLGDPKRWKEIWKLTKGIDDPDIILPGQKIVLKEEDIQRLEEIKADENSQSDSGNHKNQL